MTIPGAGRCRIGPSCDLTLILVARVAGSGFEGSYVAKKGPMNFDICTPGLHGFLLRARRDILNPERLVAEYGAPRGRPEGQAKMIFALDTWLMPAIAAGSSSYLVSLCWERLGKATAPSRRTEVVLAALSFIMGAISSYWRSALFDPSLENNVIVMFVVGASTTYLWLRLRKYFIIPRG